MKIETLKNVALNSFSSKYQCRLVSIHAVSAACLDNRNIRELNSVHRCHPHLEVHLWTVTRQVEAGYSCFVWTLNDCWWGENRGLATLGTHMKSSSFIYINMYDMLPRQHNKTVACISLQHRCYLGSKQAVPIPHIHTLVPTCSRRKSLGTKAIPSIQWNYLQMVFMRRGFSFGG